MSYEGRSYGRALLSLKACENEKEEAHQPIRADAFSMGVGRIKKAEGGAERKEN